MFNGYNETPLISYNEYDQERDKKQENVSKWFYGHDSGVQTGQTHSSNRQSEFWSGKPNFLGIPNVVRCNCSGCYSSSENQSYQGDSTRHRPWLPGTFPVPLNGSTESCKLPGYHQWENVGLSNQSSCFPEGGGGGGGIPPSQYLQEAGGKHPYYRHYPSRPEMNQPGVITSAKNAEFVKKQDEMSLNPPGQEAIFSGQNGAVPCNPGYNLTKRINSNYCDPNEKYSNVASYSLDQQVSRLPVVEPYIKAVPSINQNRVPSTGHRSLKESLPQSYIESGYGRKICSETGSVTAGEKKPRGVYQSGMPKDGVEAFQAGHPTPMDLKNINYPHFNLNRDYGSSVEMEAQKLFETGRHHDYFSRNNSSEMMKRNNHAPAADNKKDCAVSQLNQMNVPEQHYGGRPSHAAKYLDPKSSCAVFYSEKKLDHLQENQPCFSQSEDVKNENNVRLPRSTLIFNDLRFPDRGQNSFPYQNNPAAYRNYSRPEYPYQGFNLQGRFEYPNVPQNQYNPRNASQDMPNCLVDQLMPQGNNAFIFDSCQQPAKALPQALYGGKSLSPNLVQTESPHLSQERQEVRKHDYLETIRSEELTKNGTSKISPLRLLRKKKFVTQRNEPVVEPVARPPDAAPALDVRKFLSTWAEEEEECIPSTQMVVLDCQNIDPEQAKLLHLYESDPLRGVHLESGSILTMRGSTCGKQSTEQTVPLEESSETEPKNEVTRQEPTQSADSKDERSRVLSPERDVLESVNRPAVADATQKTSPSKAGKRGRSHASQEGHRNKRKSDEVSQLDKWTEKKFDFLKRAEESKAAEILRHEEEKKKIFERRLSLQPGKASRFNADRLEETKQNSSAESLNLNLPERLSPFDENSQSNSPDGRGDTSDLPTSEYRRNKFLDYSERKVIANGNPCKEESENERVEDAETKVSILKSPEKEKIKLECSQPKPTPFPETPKLKEEMGFRCLEMDDLLKKMSEINVDGSDVKAESGDHPRKARTASHGKKSKKNKKPEQENEEKLTVENISVSKPTIKFSIQKSHDLKISFKVLNGGGNKKYEHSDEEVGGGEAEERENSVEDSENSTEMITLKYKSVQRDGSNCDLELKKNRRRFRRKKAGESPEMKTPVLKIKKSRYLPQEEEERDPLGEDAESPNRSKSEYSTSDDFQVHEAVDSAKIKLTFKRHRGNFETEYKINNGLAKVTKDEELEETASEGTDGRADGSDDWVRKDSRRTKDDLIIREADVESLAFEENHQEAASEVESSPESGSKEVEPGSGPEEDFGNSGSSQESRVQDSTPGTPLPATFPSDASTESTGGKENSGDLTKVTPAEEDLNDDCQEQVESVKSDGNRDEDVRSEIKLDEFSPDCNTATASADAVGGKESFHDFEEEEIQEISLDFIRNTNSPEIETNDAAGKAESSETPRESAFEIQGDNFWEEKTSFNTNESSQSDDISGSFESKAEDGKDDDRKTSFSDAVLENEKSEEKTVPRWVDCVPEVDAGKSCENSLFDLADTVFDAIQNNEKESSTLLEVEASEIKRTDPKPSGDTFDFDDEQSGGGTTTAVSEGGAFECTTEENMQSEAEGNVAEPEQADPELEEGEIVDDDDDNDNNDGEAEPVAQQMRTKEFKINRIQRRHSINSVTQEKQHFSKAKSCPPEMEFTIETAKQEVGSDIPVADIPLPPGSPPPENCFDFVKYFKSKATFPEEELTGEKGTDVLQTDPLPEVIPQSSAASSDCKIPENPSPSPLPQVDIFQRTSKIKFSLSKKIKFPSSLTKPRSGIGKKAEETSKPGFPKDASAEEKSEKVEEATPREKTDVTGEPNAEPKTQPNADKEETSQSEVKRNQSPEEPRTDLTCEDMDLGESENVEVIDVMSFDSGDFIRDELYECEDIPTSEDLPSGMEVEKVPDDDKFRNMMQNCLDNAKKFLNVGNLKLFSWSVDDLLELDCELEESEREKSTGEPANHISRDVLLTSCEDGTNDDLGLSEKFQPEDMSMDFVPSFCSDVCPEILPVDNWPYLEEEVPASPTRSKQDETDLIPESGAFSDPTEGEDSVTSHLNSPHPKNGRSRNKGTKVFLPGIENGGFRRFRRGSLVADRETFRMCSKINLQRRKTIEGFGGNLLSYGKECDLKTEITKLRNGINKMENLWMSDNSLKCRLSLEKITNGEDRQRLKSPDAESLPGGPDTASNDGLFTRKSSKRKYSLDYKSSIWQPKVMLFRISKNDLKKRHRRSKTQTLSESSDLKRGSDDGDAVETCSKPPVKKQKSSGPAPRENTKYVKTELEDQLAKDVRKEDRESSCFSEINSIKGSVSAATAPDPGKRKKSRFRNLHPKRKSDQTVAEAAPPAQNTTPAELPLVDAESVLSELFKEADVPKKRVSNSPTKSTKETALGVKESVVEKLKKPDEADLENGFSSEKERRSRSREKSSRHRSHGEKSEKRHDHRDRRRERSGGRKEDHAADHKQKHKERERREMKHGRGRHFGRSPERKRHLRREEVPREGGRSNSGDEGRGKAKRQELTPEEAWICQVCGFSDANERISHIKKHPFHCQSCHLAFKTETYFISHLTNKHKDIRNQHHCLLCELSFDTVDQYYSHLETREHKHLESVEKNTINTLFTLLTGRPCPVLGIVEMKPEWLPNQAGTVHFYHQATPLSLALQYLKMHHDLSSYSTVSSAHSN